MTSTSLTCSVCLDNCYIPVALKCNHYFCYLCLKGASQTSKTCPLCRKKFTRNELDNPNLLKFEEKLDPTSFQWSYEGRNGFWLFDQETKNILENSFQNKEKTCQVLIAGNIYVVDFDKMIQYRKDLPFKKRKIKREKLKTQNVKGVAGVSKQILKFETDKKENKINIDKKQKC